MRTRIKIGPSLPAFKLGTTKKYQLKTPELLVSTLESNYAYNSGRRDNTWVCVDELHKGPPFRDGGPLNMFKLSGAFCKAIGLSGSTIVPGTPDDFRWEYSGKMIPNWYPTINTTEATNNAQFLAQFESRVPLATGAYTKFSPLKPRVQLGQTLAEIREIPRMLMSSAKFFRTYWLNKGGYVSKRIPWYKTGNNLASEWLNTQFGWLPFLGTIGDIAKTISTVDLIVDRLRKHNGKWEKRGGVIEETQSRDVFAPKTSTTTANVYPVLVTQLGGSTGSSQAFTEKVQTTWFSARYRYYIPELLPNGGFPLSLTARLFGLELTPRLVYDLIPWSWLVDWFTGLGDIIENVSPSKFGGLVTNGAYLMTTSTLKYVFTTQKKCGSTTTQATWEAPLVHKERTKAPSPYGFDSPLEGLSSWQLSILAALGWNRLSRRFPKKIQSRMTRYMPNGNNFKFYYYSN